MTVNILIVDDHPVVRFGLRGMLEAYDDLRVVGEAAPATRRSSSPPRRARTSS